MRFKMIHILESEAHTRLYVPCFIRIQSGVSLKK